MRSIELLKEATRGVGIVVVGAIGVLLGGVMVWAFASLLGLGAELAWKEAGFSGCFYRKAAMYCSDCSCYFESGTQAALVVAGGILSILALHLSGALILGKHEE